MKGTAIAVICALLLILAAEKATAQDKTGLVTQNVILVTLDGVRVQEVFGGIDETIAVHDEQQVYSEIATARERYGAATAEARREALMRTVTTSRCRTGCCGRRPDTPRS
jgi:hypothetical protein